MKIPVAELSEQTKLEAGIGFTSGILVGAIASFVLIIFFTPWQWYFKVFSGIGSLGIVGSLLMSLNEQIKARRLYIAAVAEMNKAMKPISTIPVSPTQPTQTLQVTGKAGDSNFPVEVTGTSEELKELKENLNKSKSKKKV